METITFSVRFHTPFLVRGGAGGAGLDAFSRADAVLPASSLKGAMRAAAQHALGLDPAVVEAVFGMQGRHGGRLGAGSWAWTDARSSAPLVRGVRARNRVDERTGVVVPEALTYSEEIWQDDDVDLSFDVEQRSVVDAGDLERHVTVLQVAAHAVTALGSWRNRGMGAVTVRPTDPLPDLARRWDDLQGGGRATA